MPTHNCPTDNTVIASDVAEHKRLFQPTELTMGESGYGPTMLKNPTENCAIEELGVFCSYMATEVR